MRETAAAIGYLDRAVIAAGGTALRYGAFYGAANDGLLEPVRKRQFPIVGHGGGVFSWIHLDDAATATVLALEHGGPAIYNIIDLEPAPCASGCPCSPTRSAPSHPATSPVRLARLMRGRSRGDDGNRGRGASNAKAKRELDWTPSLSQLAQGVPGRLLGTRRGRRTEASTGHADEPFARLTRMRTADAQPEPQSQPHRCAALGEMTDSQGADARRRGGHRRAFEFTH